MACVAIVSVVFYAIAFAGVANVNHQLSACRCYCYRGSVVGVVVVGVANACVAIVGVVITDKLL